MISTHPPIKGLSPYTLGLVKELSKNVEIDFYGFKSIYPEFLYPGGTKTNEPEPTIKNVNIKNYLTWYNPFSWIRTGLSINTDIVHAQWWSWFLAPVYLTTLTIAKLRGKKIIMTIHNVKPHEKSFIKNFLNNSVIGLANEYIVHSEDNKRKFNSKKNVSVIPLGLDIKKEIKKETAIQKLNLPQNKSFLLFFGNIRDYKGLDILISALEEMKRQDVILLIAGQIWDKKLLDQIKNKTNIIYSNGFVKPEEVIYYFSASDLVVYPYKYFDASSAAAAEALSYEKAIVVTNVGGLPELVKDKNVIAKSNDVTDLKDKIVYALKNKMKLEKDSKAITKKFAWNVIAKMTRGVYRR